MRACLSMWQHPLLVPFETRTYNLPPTYNHTLTHTCARAHTRKGHTHTHTLKHTCTSHVKIINLFHLLTTSMQNATFEDNNGRYRCAVYLAGGGNEDRSADVTVLRAPTKPSFVVQSGGVSDISGPFVEGNTYEILCASTMGNPKPRIVWTRDGSEISATASADELKLTRQFKREDHNVVFSCSVNNNAIEEPLVRRCSLSRKGVKRVALCFLTFVLSVYSISDLFFLLIVSFHLCPTTCHNSE